jgi:predicted Zn-dependent peptidase
MSPHFATNPFRKLSIALALLFLAAGSFSGFPQVTIEPQREQLLNGLRILLWTRPGDQDVLIKLRIHSGAAFDVAGKAGEMAILGDILFPDQNTRDYFTEMGGRLDVDTDYDSITITMQGRASEFERIVGILRTALITTQITPENVARIRQGRIKIVKETNISAAMLADRAIAARLFGDFPYGRPLSGSAETLARVDRADLLLAQERFLNPNNATLVIIGSVERNRAMRALRQLLGSWRKSEQIIPTTFRQPEPADSRTLIINAPSEQSAEIRLATRGVARSDHDFPAATILAILARKRWEALSPELTRSPVFVRNEAHVLPGIFVMGATVDALLAGKTLKTGREVFQSLTRTPVSAAELEQARNEVVAPFTRDLEKPDGIGRAWLDIETFRLSSISEQIRAFTSVSSSDIQRVAAMLFGEARVASAVIGNSKQLRATLDPILPVEMMGELEKPQPAKSPEKPLTTIPVKKPE